MKSDEIIFLVGVTTIRGTVVKGGSLRKAEDHCSGACFLQHLVLEVSCEYHFNLHINLLTILQAKKVINSTREINTFPPGTQPHRGSGMGNQQPSPDLTSGFHKDETASVCSD